MLKFNKTLFATNTLLILWLLPSSEPVPAASPTSVELTPLLAKQVSDYNLGSRNFVNALIRVTSDFHIPLGLTWTETPSTLVPLSFAWKKATVTEIIKDIVDTQAGYAVYFDRLIVHVSPESSIPDAENFLKLKIAQFSTHDAYVEVASFKLHTLVTPRKYGQISIGATGDSKVSLELTDCTLEQALDSLALASNRKIWIVTYSKEDKLTSRGFRKTLSLWTDKPVPDEEQPVWQLLRWGDPIPPALESVKSK